MAQAPDRRTLTAFALIVVIAGLNFVAVKYSNYELAPFWGAALRFGSAGLLLGWFCILTRRTFPQGRALAGTAIYGTLGFGLSYAGAYYGLVDLGPGLASVVLALVPLITFLLASVQGLERLSWRGLTGAGVSVAGIAVVFADQLAADAAPLALLALVVASLAIAESSIVLKRMPRTNPFATNAVAMLIGSSLLLGLSLARGEPHGLPARPDVAFAVVYLVFVGSIGLFGLFLYVLSHWTASGSSYQFVLSPLVTVAASSMLTAEAIRPGFVLGATLVLAGVYVGALRGRRPTPVPVARDAAPERT